MEGRCPLLLRRRRWCNLHRALAVSCPSPHVAAFSVFWAADLRDPTSPGTTGLLVVETERCLEVDELLEVDDEREQACRGAEEHSRAEVEALDGMRSQTRIVASSCLQRCRLGRKRPAQGNTVALGQDV